MTRRRHFSTASFFVLFVIFVRSSFACDTCGLHNSFQLPGVVSAARAVGFQSGAITTSVSHQTSLFKIRGDNGLRTTDDDLELVKSFSSTQFAASYNFTSKAGVQLTLPVITRSYDHFVRYRRERDSETGLGDMNLLGTYSPYSWSDCDSRVFSMLFGGLKLPTGKTGSLQRVSQAASASGNDPSLLLQGRGLSLGTGSLDVPVGFTVYGRYSRVFGLAVAQYSFRSEGAADYRFANDVAWSLTPGYFLEVDDTQSLSLGVAVSGENKGADRLNGEALTRTSANNVYVGPEVIYMLSNKLTLQLGADVPVVLDVNGAAVEPEGRLRTLINWIF